MTTLTDTASLLGFASPAVLADAGAGTALAGLIPILPALGAVICTVAATMGVRSKMPAWITVALLAVSFLVTVFVFRAHTGEAYTVKLFDWFNLSWGEGEGQSLVANFSFYIDSLTILWMLFVTGLGALIALYASEYMSHDQGVGYCRFFVAFNLFVVSMACLVMGDNLILLYLGWEGVGLCSYLLIGYFYKKPSAVAAAKKAFIVNRIGDLGLALGIYLIFVHFGTVEYAVLFAEDGLLRQYVAAAAAGDFGSIPGQAQAIALLLMIGAFGKSAQLPLYVWLPDAMEGPTPVSALIHAATMVTAGVYLIARAYPLFLASELALPIVAWVGTLTALLAATIAMAQFDIKRIMAYSTVSQLGYMFAGLGVLTTTGAAFHVLTHAFFKALLFLACGAVMHGFAGQLDLRRLSGLARVRGWQIVAVGMFIGCLNLSGFPLITSGYFSKDMILAEAFYTPGFAAIGWILLLTAGLTAYYTFRVFFRVFLGPVEYHPGADDHGQEHEVEQGELAGETPPEGHAHEHAKTPHADAEHAEEAGFHPHAPGWAINSVLVVLAVLSTLAIGLYFISPGTHGWVGSMVHASTADYTNKPAEPGTLFGQDPHELMYYVSAVVGLIGIGAAFWLHLAGRKSASECRVDGIAARMGPIPRWAENKWYVDELYEFLFRRPLLVLSHLLHQIDKWVLDKLVDVLGMLPRWLAGAVRPLQGGALHGYATGMVAGITVLVVIVLLMLFAGGVTA